MFNIFSASTFNKVVSAKLVIKWRPDVCVNMLCFLLFLTVCLCTVWLVVTAVVTTVRAVINSARNALWQLYLFCVHYHVNVLATLLFYLPSFLMMCHMYWLSTLRMSLTNSFIYWTVTACNVPQQVCYKVSLCENFQRHDWHSCSYIVLLSSGRESQSR